MASSHHPAITRQKKATEKEGRIDIIVSCNRNTYQIKVGPLSGREKGGHTSPGGLSMHGFRDTATLCFLKVPFKPTTDKQFSSLSACCSPACVQYQEHKNKSYNHSGIRLQSKIQQDNLTWVRKATLFHASSLIRVSKMSSLILAGKSQFPAR